MSEHGGAPFLKIPRREAGSRPVSERVRDFAPVDQPLTEAELREQASRCMACGTPFCHGYGCPLANVIPELNGLAARGRWKEAWALLTETNPFPEWTGRLCPALCEAACVCGIHGSAVTIRQVERLIADKAFEMGYFPKPPPRLLDHPRVAIVGSGPAGLAAAWRLNRGGVPVTVFEKADRIGGLLRYGIPDFKFDRRLLDRRLQAMEACGIRFEPGVEIGTDLSARYLLDRFDRLLLAAGAQQPRDLKIPGRELAGIVPALPFLIRQNRLNQGEPDPDPRLDARDRNVLIIGGGDTGADCLGTALRQGARRVLQFEILPRPPDTRPADTPWPQWPRILRKSSSHEEGGERRWSVMTTRFEGRNGHVSRAWAVEVEWVEEASGRFVPREKPGTAFSVDTDLVILALGFTGPEPQPIVTQLGLECDDAGRIRPRQGHGTSHPAVWVAGDMAQGPSLVVRAVADGLSAAVECAPPEGE